MSSWSCMFPFRIRFTGTDLDDPLLLHIVSITVIFLNLGRLWYYLSIHVELQLVLQYYSKFM